MNQNISEGYDQRFTPNQNFLLILFSETERKMVKVKPETEGAHVEKKVWKVGGFTVTGHSSRMEADAKMDKKVLARRLVWVEFRCVPLKILGNKSIHLSIYLYSGLQSQPRLEELERGERSSPVAGSRSGRTGRSSRPPPSTGSWPRSSS